MEDINSTTQVGRLVRDAELKYTNSGTPVTKMSIAVNRSVKKSDQWEDVASFFDVTLWGKRGESLNQYLQRGTRIAVKGSLVQERWDQDGQTRSRVIIHADNVQLLGGNQQGQQSNQNTGGYNQTNPTYTKNQGNNSYNNQGGSGNFENDIPFMRSDLERRF